MSDRVIGLLGDYTDHFGCRAADAFAAFIQAELMTDGDCVPMQQPLFV